MFNQQTDIEPKLNLAILRESVATRARQAPIAFAGTLMGAAAFVTLLAGSTSSGALLLWILPMILSVGWRLSTAWRAHQQLSNPSSDLTKLDQEFLVNSIATQAWCGAGMWIITPAGDALSPYVMTIAVCVFAVGAMLSVANDFRSILYSMPLLLGQAIAFWLLKGGEGFIITLPLALLLLLALSFGRQTNRIAHDSIRTRFKNDDLLAQLEEEKRVVLHALSQAEEANRSKSRFLAAASHDLRQPLHAISLHRDTLAMQELSSEARHIVDQQGAALRVLVQLFDNLLEMSRLETGNLEVDPAPLRLNGLFEELQIEFSQAARNKNLQLHIQHTEATVLSDRNLLMRLIRNLVSNAVQYTDAGRIDITAEVSTDRVVVSVQDTGLGIAAADQDKIFGEFVQLRNPHRDRSNGVGLGLSIVRRIAHLLDIELSLTSAPGVGTTVSFAVPSSNQHVIPTPSIGAIDVVDQQAYIWVVEDDRLLRDALAQNFASHGIALDVAASRTELEALAESKGMPDFAILDDMLGLEDSGLDLADWLQSFMPVEAILIMTGNVDPERVALLDASPYKVVRKPVASTDLLVWMNSVGQSKFVSTQN